MNSVCGKVLGDFARSVLHHHRAVADPDHAIFGNEHGAEQDPGIRPDADRSTHHRGGHHAGAGVNPRCLAVPPARPGLPRMLGRTPYGTRSSPLPWTPGSRSGTYRKPLRTLIRAPQCAERARGSLDRHATYIVAAYIAGAAR